MFKVFFMFCLFFGGINAQDSTNYVVAVFCSGSDDIATEFKTFAFELGRFLGEEGYSLLTGGGCTGLMKEVASGYVTTPWAYEHFQAIILKKYASRPCSHHLSLLDQNITWVENTHERLTCFYNSADAFLIMPGGFGTLLELVDCINHSKQDGRKRPIILLNLAGFWNPLIKQFQAIVASNEDAQQNLYNFFVINSLSECTKSLKAFRETHNPHEAQLA